MFVCVFENIFALNDACEGLFVCLWDDAKLRLSHPKRDKKLDHFKDEKKNFQ